jgi:hypothetical protein
VKRNKYRQQLAECQASRRRLVDTLDAVIATISADYPLDKDDACIVRMIYQRLGRMDAQVEEACQ